MEACLVAVVAQIRLVPVELLVGGIVEDFALPGQSEHDELVAAVTADGAKPSAFIGTAWMPMRWKVRR